MSAPAAARETAVRARRGRVESLSIVVAGVVRGRRALIGDDDAAVAVVGVLAEADVGDEDEGVEARDCLEGAESLLDDALLGIGSGGVGIFFGGKAEEEQAAEAESGAGFGFFDGFVDGEIEDAGHGGDFLADAFAGTDKERVDEGGRGEMGFADEGAQRRSAAETAHAGDGEVHKGRVLGSGDEVGGARLVIWAGLGSLRV